MARRKTSSLEDVIDLASRVPWRIGVVLAAVAYLVLHALATREIAPATDLRAMGNMAAAQLFKTFAFFGQYFLPGALLIGALISVMKRHKLINWWKKHRRRLYFSIKNHPFSDGNKRSADVPVSAVFALGGHAPDAGRERPDGTGIADCRARSEAQGSDGATGDASAGERWGGVMRGGPVKPYLPVLMP